MKTDHSLIPHAFMRKSFLLQHVGIVVSESPMFSQASMGEWVCVWCAEWPLQALRVHCVKVNRCWPGTRWLYGTMLSVLCPLHRLLWLLPPCKRPFLTQESTEYVSGLPFRLLRSVFVAFGIFYNGCILLLNYLLCSRKT